jgi:hypothetical protein
MRAMCISGAVCLMGEQQAGVHSEEQFGRLSQKKKSSGSGTGSTQPREYT